MAITAAQPVIYRRYNGYSDPRFPEGTWHAVQVVIGDLSGGIMAVHFVFNPDTAPVISSRIFSLEQLSINQNDDSDRTYHLRTGNMGDATQEERHDRALEVRGMLSGGGSLDGREAAAWPMFLGSQRAPLSLTALLVQMTNINGFAFTAGAEGYWWGARSVLADGGPQRPVPGLYRA